MKAVFGIIFILLGIAAGVYCGVWLMLVGGIIQVIEGAKMDPVSSFDIAIGIVRFLFAGVVGWLSFLIPSAIGGALIGSTDNRKTRFGYRH